jgi:7-cyano-7-deazaguanine synthase
MVIFLMNKFFVEWKHGWEWNMGDQTPKDVPIEDGEEAVLALSGGPDSSTMLEWALDQGIEPRPVNFDQGLDHSEAELKAAQDIASEHDLSLEVFDVSEIVSMLGASSIMIHSEAHNLRFGSAILLSISVCHAVEQNIPHVLVATHDDDAQESLEYSPQFHEPMQEAIEVATSGEADLPEAETIQIHAPFSHMSKSEVLDVGSGLGVPFERTWSCIVGEKTQCGGCGACSARQQAFKKAGIVDPTTYQVENTISGPNSQFAASADD